MMRKLVISSEPAIEPLTLLQVKNHLRLDSEDFEDDISAEQTIVPNNHGTAAAYSLVGTGIDVLGVESLMQLNSGENGASGTVDVKMQDSDDDSTYTDVTDGAFTQVTTVNDNAIQEKAYTGGKQYLRAVATVANATCDFAVTVLKNIATVSDDAYLTRIRKVARVYVEKTVLSRAFITQTWKGYLTAWPTEDDFIVIAKPPLQSVTSLKYTDSSDDVTTVSTDVYDVDTVSDPGEIKLKYNQSWPTVTLRPMRPIEVEFVAGYGDAGSDQPEPIRQGILITIAELYENREETIVGLTAQKLGWLTEFLSDYRVEVF